MRFGAEAGWGRSGASIGAHLPLNAATSQGARIRTGARAALGAPYRIRRRGPRPCNFLQPARLRRARPGRLDGATTTSPHPFGRYRSLAGSGIVDRVESATTVGNLGEIASRRGLESAVALRRGDRRRRSASVHDRRSASQPDHHLRYARRQDLGRRAVHGQCGRLFRVARELRLDHHGRGHAEREHHHHRRRGNVHRASLAGGRLDLRRRPERRPKLHGGEGQRRRLLSARFPGSRTATRRSP